MQKISGSRRDFLKSATALAASVSSFGTATSLFATEKEEKKSIAPLGKAEHCIFVWLSGGASQIDTFDPKARGDLKKKAGGAYDMISTNVDGLKVTEHLPRMAKPVSYTHLTLPTNREV